MCRHSTVEKTCIISVEKLERELDLLLQLKNQIWIAMLENRGLRLVVRGVVPIEVEAQGRRD